MDAEVLKQEEGGTQPGYRLRLPGFAPVGWNLHRGDIVAAMAMAGAIGHLEAGSAWRI